MTGSLDRIAVLGLGKVGLLAARLLARQRIRRRRDRPASDSTSTSTGVSSTASTSRRRPSPTELDGVDAVLSCLPYHLNVGVAETAHRLGLHYFDLTEDVPTTTRIRELAETSDGVMAPQCGLAPGFVGIVAASQADSLERCRSIRMRVGALPQHPTGRLAYAFNWSPEGVVNEYLNDCEVIEDGERKMGVADGVARDDPRRRDPPRSVHHVGRSRHDV